MKTAKKLIKDVTVSIALVAIVITILSLIYAGMNHSHGAEPVTDCKLAWDYDPKETRHHGFQVFDKIKGKLYHGTVPEQRSVTCNELNLENGVQYSLAVRAYNFADPNLGASQFSNYIDVRINRDKLQACTNFRIVPK